MNTIEELNLVSLPDDMLREIGSRLDTYSTLSLRHTCQEFLRVFPKPENKYQIMFDKMVERKEFKKDWPTYPKDSYVVQTGKCKQALVFRTMPGKIHVVPNCARNTSAILRLSCNDLNCRVIEGKFPQKRTKAELSSITLAIWMVYEKTVPIEEFYPRVMAGLKAL